MLLLFHGSNFRPTPTADVEYGLPRWHFPFLNGGKTCLKGRRRQPQKLTREAESELKKMMYKYEKESEEKNNIKKKWSHAAALSSYHPTLASKKPPTSAFTPLTCTLFCLFATNCGSFLLFHPLSPSPPPFLFLFCFGFLF